MKELLLQYAGYNIWANKLILDVILGLPEEKADQEVLSSFPSIRGTIYHTWAAENIWLQRLQLVEHPVWMPDVFTGTLADACTKWATASAGLEAFVQKQFNDAALQHVVAFYDRQKKERKMQVFHVLQHVFNHSTYHRGQLVTMLRQVGETKIPGTDFVIYVNWK